VVPTIPCKGGSLGRTPITITTTRFLGRLAPGRPAPRCVRTHPPTDRTRRYRFDPHKSELHLQSRGLGRESFLRARGATSSCGRESFRRARVARPRRTARLPPRCPSSPCRTAFVSAASTAATARCAQIRSPPTSCPDVSSPIEHGVPCGASSPTDC
jgi:hypothetical protein